MGALNKHALWDEALSRLMSFLAALQIGGVEHRTRIALQIVDEARRRQAEDPSLLPVEHTMNIAMARLDEWFTAALANVEVPAGRRVSTGLVSLQVMDATRRWPDVVLADLPPDELKEALARVSFRTGPDLAVSRMTPREMDYGAMETIAQETWHRFAWAPLVRAAILWTGIFFGALYVYDHFFLS